MTHSEPWIYLLLALCLLLHYLMSRTGPLWRIILSLPATICHETAHYLIASITGGRPSGFSIIPRKQDLPNGKKQWILGSVSFRPTIFSAAVTAMAPLLCLLLAWPLFVAGPSLIPEYAGGELTFWLLLVILLLACVPSRVDFFILVRYPFSTALWAGLVFGVIYAASL